MGVASSDGNLPFWPPSYVIKYYCCVIMYLWLWRIINSLSLSLSLSLCRPVCVCVRVSLTLSAAETQPSLSATVLTLDELITVN